LSYRAVLWRDAEQWLDTEPDDAKRAAVLDWIVETLNDPPLPTTDPAGDPTTVAFVTGTQIIVTFMVVPELERLFVDYIEDLG
jgi:hypothetical protein